MCVLIFSSSFVTLFVYSSRFQATLDAGYFSHFEYVFIILSSCSFVSFYVCSFELYKFPLCLTSFFLHSLVLAGSSFFVFFFSVAHNLLHMVNTRTHALPTHKFFYIVSMSQTTRKCLIIHSHSHSNLSLDHARFALQTLTHFVKPKQKKKQKRKLKEIDNAQH